MHILHPSFFILQLTGSADISEVKDGKARMHIVHPSFFILQLTQSAEISEVNDEKARMHIVHPSFFILQLTESAEISEALLRAFTGPFYGALKGLIRPLRGAL